MAELGINLTREMVEELVAKRKELGQPPAKTTPERLEDDPAGILRASIGGHPALGFYLQYRGEPNEILEMLRHVLFIAEEELK